MFALGVNVSAKNAKNAKVWMHSATGRNAFVIFD